MEEKVYCKQRCGFEDTFEPDDMGINYYQAIGECPNCGAPTVYEDGDETAVVVMFNLVPPLSESNTQNKG